MKINFRVRTRVCPVLHLTDINFLTQGELPLCIICMKADGKSVQLSDNQGLTLTANIGDLGLRHSLHCAGPLPESIGNLTNLTLLDLSSNQLLGRTHVQVCALRHSLHCAGPLPESIGNLTNLTLLDLSSNQLSGRTHVQVCALRH
jgi:Leucine-rich repeat (LRR) protein